MVLRYCIRTRWGLTQLAWSCHPMTQSCAPAGLHCPTWCLSCPSRLSGFSRQCFSPHHATQRPLPHRVAFLSSWRGLTCPAVEGGLWLPSTSWGPVSGRPPSLDMRSGRDWERFLVLWGPAKPVRSRRGLQLCQAEATLAWDLRLQAAQWTAGAPFLMGSSAELRSLTLALLLGTLLTPPPDQCACSIWDSSAALFIVDPAQLDIFSSGVIQSPSCYLPRHLNLKPGRVSLRWVLPEPCATPLWHWPFVYYWHHLISYLRMKFEVGMIDWCLLLFKFQLNV